MNLGKKFVSLAVAILFSVNSFCYGYDFSTDKLAPRSIVKQEIGDFKLNSTLRGLGKILIEKGADQTQVERVINDLFKSKKYDAIKSFVTETWESIPSLISNIVVDNDTVKINFKKNGQAYTAVVKLVARKSENDKTSTVSLRVVKGDTQSALIAAPRPDESKDIRGPEAQKADTLIKDAIRSGKMIEIGIVHGELYAYKIRFAGDEQHPYIPGTNDERRFGECIDLRKSFSPSQLENIKNWLINEEHMIPVEKDGRTTLKTINFRLILDTPAIELDSRGFMYQNIAHGGVRDSSIYGAEYLFKFLFSSENVKLRQDILENDELKHLRGFTHTEDDAPDYRARVNEIGTIVQKMHDIHYAMHNDKWAALRHMLLSAMDIKGKIRQERAVIEFLSICNDISLSMYHYPVESKYPLLRAISKLTKAEEKKLLEILHRFDGENKLNRKPLRDEYDIVDAIMLMLEKTVPEGWLEKHAPGLIDKYIWQLSSEIWYPGGGLGRVLQFHGIGIYELLGEKYRHQLRHLEPYFKFEKNKKGDYWVPMKYTEGGPLTTPMKHEPVIIKTFRIKMGNSERTVNLRYAENVLGIKCYFLEDVSSDGRTFTHSMYNWQSEKEKLLPTWSEFTEFMSKGSFEAIKLVEQDEKEQKEKENKTWKTPIIHTNDSQLSLLGYAMLQPENIDRNRFDAASKNPHITGIFDNEFKIENLNKLFKESLYVGPGETNREKNVLKLMILTSLYNDFTRELLLAATTHTYINREYTKASDNKAIEMLENVHVDHENFWEAFTRLEDNVRYRDFASWLVRSAGGIWGGWAGAVAAKHRDDVAYMDEWWPGVDIIGVTNGDHRNTTAKFFRDIYRRAANDPDADYEHPDPKILKEAKKIAKSEFYIPNQETELAKDNKDVSKRLFASRVLPDGKLLDPNKYVLSYTGRFVPEKNGRTRALSDDNIIEFVKQGLQVVIFGNKQMQDPRSKEDDARTQSLIERIARLQRENKNPNEFQGCFIYCNSFTQDEQRSVIAATDAGVLDSHPDTEAAGFSETDFASCGAIVIAPPWPRGEGIIVSQGTPINLDFPGHGNTLVFKMPLSGEEFQLNKDFDWRSNYAKDKVAVKYREEVLKFFKSENMSPDKLSSYQACSMCFSRVLEYLNTSAAYLKEWNGAVERKQGLVNMQNDLLNHPEKYTARYINPKETPISIAGSILNGLRAFDKLTETSNEPVTYEQFKNERLKAHKLSEKTFRKELNTLIALGLIVPNTVKAPYNYMWTNALRTLPTNERQMLITIILARFKNDLNVYSINAPAKISELRKNIGELIKISHDDSEKVKQDINALKSANDKLLPTIAQDKTYYRLIPADLIPATVAVGRKTMINLLKAELKKLNTDAKEKIIIVDGKKDLAAETARLTADSNNVVTVAMTNISQIEKISAAGAKGLVFEPVESDVVHLEGILAALRVLDFEKELSLEKRMEVADRLLNIHGIIADNELKNLSADDIAKLLAEPSKLASRIPFHLKPIRIFDIKELENINKRILEVVCSA